MCERVRACVGRHVPVLFLRHSYLQRRSPFSHSSHSSSIFWSSFYSWSYFPLFSPPLHLIILVFDLSSLGLLVRTCTFPCSVSCFGNYLRSTACPPIIDAITPCVVIPRKSSTSSSYPPVAAESFVGWWAGGRQDRDA